MAAKTIEKVQTSKGVSYKGRVRITLLGKTISECCRTFNTQKEAQRWVNQAYKLADNEGLNGLMKAKSYNKLLVEDAIRSILTEEPTASTLGKSKKSNLKMLLSYPIAKVPLEELSATHLYVHCELRLKGNRAPKPQTVAHDLSNLCTALKDANTFFGYPANCDAFDNARSSLQRHGFIARSEERNRRPTQLELSNIETTLEELYPDANSGLPLLDICRFARLTALRRSEIVNALWRDVDWERSTLIVRDRKHPDKKKRKDDTIPLPKEALDIIAKQPLGLSDDEPIFPYKPDSISEEWRKVLNLLNIDDLRFHDLRAEAACRLFESGLSAVEVSKITGHKSLDVLNNHYLRIKVDPARLAAA